MNIQSTIRRAAPQNWDLKAVSGKALDGVAQTSEALDRKPLLGSALTFAGNLVRSSRALPGFAYPTIYDATAGERAQIMATLDSLPLHHVSGVRSIRMVPQLESSKPGWVVHGRANDLDISNRIRLSRNSLSDPDKFARTLTHEIGHTVDYESQTLNLFGERSTREPFGEAPHITEYAKTNHREDFAESFEEYFHDPDKLKEAAPEKYEVLEDMSDPTFLERLIDREEFRETGKYMAEVFGGSEVSRHVAQGAYVASGALQGVHGISQWVRSGESGNALGHTTGILNTATGAIFLAGLNPLWGMGIQGANQALQSAVHRGQLTPEEVESTVSLPVRPLERVLGRETAKLKREHRPTRVMGVAAGGAVGGTLGSLVGPYLGVLAGYHLGGGLGGTIGLVAGGALGFVAGAELGGRVATGIANL